MMIEGELSDFKEIVHNGEFIDWGYWSNLQKITPHKAARLAFCIDPHKWDGNQYSGGDVKGTIIPKDLAKKILDFEVLLEGIKQEWTLQEIARALGENAPLGMVKILKPIFDLSFMTDLPKSRSITNQPAKEFFIGHKLSMGDNAPLGMIESINNSIENQTTTAPPVHQKEKTSLSNLPKRKDDWCEVINEMANQFYAENGAIPTAAQAWSLLCTKPPTGYAITVDKERGEDCLKMPTGKSLGKRAFQERWRKYTK